MVLIYREKHSTYACRFGDVWPPQFVRIEDDWLIQADTLAYVGYEAALVQRLRFPDFTPLDPIPLAEAKQAGLDPSGTARAAFEYAL
ncbi:MAG: hypothetical protein KC731_08195 [Myxococcales bacterium]|nr:hypothetical protein [Myxococcales bacterium]